MMCYQQQTENVHTIGLLCTATIQNLVVEMPLAQILLLSTKISSLHTAVVQCSTVYVFLVLSKGIGGRPSSGMDSNGGLLHLCSSGRCDSRCHCSGLCIW